MASLTKSTHNLGTAYTMGTFTCHCGHTWDITTAPEPHLWIAFASDVEEAVFQKEIETHHLEKDFDAKRQPIHTNDLFVSEHRTLLYECPSCGGLTWYRGQIGHGEVVHFQRVDTRP